MKKTKEVSVEYVPLSEIQRWPRNPKLHDGARIDQSIERFGFVNPLVLDESTGKLVAGHGRLEALQSMKAAGKEMPKRIKILPGGDWAVPVLKGVTFGSEQEAEAFLVADNRLVELGGWDTGMLDEMLAGFIPADLDLLGFRLGDEMDDLIEEAKATTTTTSATALSGNLDEAFVAARMKTVVCPHCGKDVPV